MTHESYGRLLLLLFVLILNTTSFYAQETNFTYVFDSTTRFDKMGVKEGLSSEYTTCIHQDKFGFIWIGTQFGLNLFDGYQVIQFIANPEDSNSINTAFILTIYEEPDGTMWFGTSSGISKYDRANKSFINYIPDTLDSHAGHNHVLNILADGDDFWIDTWDDLFLFNKKTGLFKAFANDTLLPPPGVNREWLNTLVDKEGNVWAVAYDNREKFSLFKFNKKTQTLTQCWGDNSTQDGFPNYEVMSSIEDKDGTIWLALDGGGLLEIIDKEKCKFRHFTHNSSDKNSITTNNLNTVFEDSKGNIWTGGPGGFSLLNRKNGRFLNFQIPNISINHKLPNFIKKISEGQNGNLLLTSRDGFFVFNPSNRLLHHYLYDAEHQLSFFDANVIQVISSHMGQIWLATWNNGIYRINQFSNEFKNVKNLSNAKNSLNGNYIHCLLVDSKNNFWIGCAQGGLYKTKMNSQKVFKNFEHYFFDTDNPKSLSGNTINAIYEDLNQVLWVGTSDGLNRYDENSKSFTRFQNKPNDSTTISSNAVEAIFEDSYGTFWIGTRDGLNIMDRKTGHFTRIMPDKNNFGAILNHTIRRIFEDSRGELWFGGYFLERYKRSDNTFIHYFADSMLVKDFEKTGILNIVEDDSANLWISTKRGGLLKYNRLTKRFTTFTTGNGLPSNTINAIEIDDRGYIWVSSNQGLSRISPIDYTIENFDEADGLLSLEFIDKSSFKDKDGWLYFGTRNGFNFFQPDSLKENTFGPPVYITAIYVAGKQKYFERPLFEKSNIELKYNENDISFGFVALNYVNPEKNQYSYKLEGYDNDWNYVGNRRTAYYTNLSPGEYNFRVIASNNEGFWNDEGASLIVGINPPFWKTWWAYLSYFLLFFGLLYLLRRYELNRLHLKQGLEIKKVEAEKLEELTAEKNKFFSNISHEFRTPLTLILGPLDKILSNIKSSPLKEDLIIIRRNSLRLQVLINQILNLSKLESGKMKLYARPLNIVQLTRTLIQPFQSYIGKKGIKLDFQADAEEHIVYIDSLKFEKIINNLLSNAIKYTEDSGKIKVTIDATYLYAFEEKKEISGILLKICDTGIGIRKERLPFVFDRFYQVDEEQLKTRLGTGIGLALAKELVELHHGKITVDSDPGMGTTFSIFIPKGKEHLSEEEIIKSKNHVIENTDDPLNIEVMIEDTFNRLSASNNNQPAHSELPLILIVEDNEDMRTYIKSYLASDYNIIEATNGREGAEKAIELVPDLIVSDLMMPFVDGNEMTIQLKNDERTSHIPIILLTAKVSMESKLEGLETGADDFLTKPFDANELLIRIKNLIEQRKKLRMLLSQHIGDTVQTKIIKESSNKTMSKMDEQFLEKTKKIIEQHMADTDFSVELFARKMGMSRVQLHRKLTSLTDNTASDLIRNIRLNKAAELLKEGNLNITQISYEVGISTISYFSKIFKDKYGVSPSEFTDV